MEPWTVPQRLGGPVTPRRSTRRERRQGGVLRGTWVPGDHPSLAPPDATPWGGLTDEQQREDDGELVHRVAQDVLHHGARDQGLVPAIRFPQQQRLGGWLRRQGQRGKRVHDQVHPQHLHGFERRVLWRGGSHPHVDPRLPGRHSAWGPCHWHEVQRVRPSQKTVTSPPLLLRYITRFRFLLLKYCQSPFSHVVAVTQEVGSRQSVGCSQARFWGVLPQTAMGALLSSYTQGVCPAPSFSSPPSRLEISLTGGTHTVIPFLRNFQK